MSLGVDHMKYVVQQNQEVLINGNIDNSSTTYNGNYNETINIEDGFLKFEHSDGLNYINFEYRRFDNLV